MGEPTKEQVTTALSDLLDALDRMNPRMGLSQNVIEAQANARRLIPRPEPDPRDVATPKDEGLRSVQ